MSNELLEQAKFSLAALVEERKKTIRNGYNLNENKLEEVLTPLFNSLISKLEDARLSNSDLIKAISNIKIELPKIIIPEIKVPEIKVPEIKIPEIKIPEIKSPEIKVPEIKVPQIKIPEIKIPDIRIPQIKVPEIKVPKSDFLFPDLVEVGLKDVDAKNPLPVILMDNKGNPYIAQSVGGSSRSPATFDITTTGQLVSASLNFAALGDNTVISSVANTTIRIFKLFFVTAAATNIIFKDGSINLTGSMSFAANGSITLDFNQEPWFVTSRGNNFVINLSAAVQCSGRIYYIQI